ncbi:MAG: rRNA (guanosine2251-2-O)-methyltransferase [Actinomycetota bacterium]
MFIVVYGRMPVLEALLDEEVRVEKVLLARSARGDSVDEIVDAAKRRGVAVQKVAPEKVTRVSGNGRHDQGVVADVVAPGLRELDDEIDALRSDGRSGRGGRLALLVLDGVTNPANVGMIIRTVTGAGLDGVVLPRAGSPDVGPLVVKASAGVAFRARVYRSATAAAAVELLRGAGVEVVGLRGDAAESLFDASLPDRIALVLGNETEGVSVDVDRWVSIPMSNGVESLNVAVAAGLVAYEISRRDR